MTPVAKRNASAGFTLIEVLVASVVLVVGVVGMMAVFPQSFRDTTNSGRLSMLNHLAAERIEELRRLGYSNSNLNTGTHPTLSTDSTGKKYYAVTGFDEEVSLRWTVSGGPTDGSGNAVADMKTIRIEATYLVRYDNSGNPIEGDDSLTVAMSTFVTDED